MEDIERHIDEVKRIVAGVLREEELSVNSEETRARIKARLEDALMERFRALDDGRVDVSELVLPDAGPSIIVRVTFQWDRVIGALTPKGVAAYADGDSERLRRRDVSTQIRSLVAHTLRDECVADDADARARVKRMLEQSLEEGFPYMQPSVRVMEDRSSGMTILAEVTFGHDAVVGVTMPNRIMSYSAGPGMSGRTLVWR